MGFHGVTWSSFHWCRRFED